MKLRIPLLCVISACLTISSCASVKQQSLINQRQNQLSTQLDELAQSLAAQKGEIKTLDENLHTLNKGVEELNSNMKTLTHKSPNTPIATVKRIETPPAIAKPPVKIAKSTPELHSITPEKLVLGRVEWAMIDIYKQYLKARVDTGAKSSSLHATNVQFFERDGEKWVKFNIYSHEKMKPSGDITSQLETPLVRTVKIKQASHDKPEERAVIRLLVEVGDLRDETEFTLTNRDNMNYPILLGRNFLRDIAIVDVARSFTQKRKASNPKGKKRPK